MVDRAMPDRARTWRQIAIFLVGGLVPTLVLIRLLPEHLLWLAPMPMAALAAPMLSVHMRAYGTWWMVAIAVGYIALDSGLWLALWLLVYLATVAVLAPTTAVGPSMYPTHGVWVFGLLWPPRWVPPRAGDVVTLRVEKGFFVKRVVATAGETVCFEQGTWRVDGARDHRGSVLPLDITTAHVDLSREVVVPPGHVFVLGDHISSYDSRHFGTVPSSQILGRWAVLLSLGAPAAAVLEPEDEADLAAVRAAIPAPPLAESLELALRQRCDVLYLRVALAMCLVQAGAPPEQADATLARMRKASPMPEQVAGRRAVHWVMAGRPDRALEVMHQAVEPESFVAFARFCEAAAGRGRRRSGARRRPAGGRARSGLQRHHPGDPRPAARIPAAIPPLAAARGPPAGAVVDITPIAHRVSCSVPRIALALPRDTR